MAHKKPEKRWRWFPKPGYAINKGALAIEYHGQPWRIYRKIFRSKTFFGFRFLWGRTNHGEYTGGCRWTLLLWHPKVVASCGPQDGCGHKHQAYLE